VIIYDLKCEKNHRFEGWFDDRAAFEAQKSGKFISCPVCGSTDIEIIPSTVAVLGRIRETTQATNERYIR